MTNLPIVSAHRLPASCWRRIYFGAALLAWLLFLASSSGAHAAATDWTGGRHAAVRLITVHAR